MSEIAYDTTEAVWYKVLVFIVSGIIVGVSIANIVYYNRLRDGSSASVSDGEATAMMWVNIVVLVIAALIFLWSLWRLIFSRESRKKVKMYVSDPRVGATRGYTIKREIYEDPRLIGTSAAAIEASPAVQSRVLLSSE